MARRWQVRAFVSYSPVLAVRPWFDTVWLLYGEPGLPPRYLVRSSYEDGSDEPVWRIESRFHSEFRYGS